MQINNELLTSWMLGLMAKEVLGMITRVETSYQIWSSLEEKLLPMTKDKKVHLTDSLLTLIKGSMSIDEYLKKFKGIYMRQFGSNQEANGGCGQNVPTCLKAWTEI